MILAAGLGTRLGKITEETPKCLVEVGSKTLLEHVVDRLKVAGVSELVINLHHLADKVKSFVTAKKNFGLTVYFSFEPEILGTGGGLKKAQQFFGTSDSFIVHNADVYCDFDLKRLFQMQENSSAVATLLVMKRETDRALVFNSKSELTGWENKKENKSDLVGEGERFGFSGIQAVSPKIFELMREESGSFSIIRPYMKAARSGLKVMSCDMNGAYWVDAGTPERLEGLRTYLKKGQRPK